MHGAEISDFGDCESSRARLISDSYEGAHAQNFVEISTKRRSRKAADAMATTATAGAEAKKEKAVAGAEAKKEKAVAAADAKKDAAKK